MVDKKDGCMYRRQSHPTPSIIGLQGNGHTFHYGPNSFRFSTHPHAKPITGIMNGPEVINTSHDSI